jgi:2-polyprenyl-6-hydroxyphenyl methylase/3-demethylubiquinone-9 3-methyltransferase
MNSESTGRSGQAPGVDTGEIRKFDAAAADWWRPDGPFRPLHDLNPVRCSFVQAARQLDGADVVDLGCGGGLLSEAMARAGARVTGVDASLPAIAAARRHALISGVDIAYVESGAAEFAATHRHAFDLVTCMELLEHVPDPAALVQACAAMLRPSGDLVLSTVNRTPQAFVGAILGAEYLLRLLPKGTHDYARFVRPSELDSWLRAAGFGIVDLAGIEYTPWSGTARLCNRPVVNYIVHARRR